MGLFGDTWASNASKAAANTAGTQAGTLFGQNEAIQAQLLPFFRGEMLGSHAFTPDQLNEMLSYAGAGAGGATGSLAGEAALSAGRTGNTAGYQGLLDKIARAKAQGLAKANEGIAAEDVSQTLKNKQLGAAGMAGLGSEDLSAAMKAMGIQSEDIANQIKASDTGGWMRNLIGSISSLSGSAAPFAKLAAGAG